VDFTQRNPIWMETPFRSGRRLYESGVFKVLKDLLAGFTEKKASQQKAVVGFFSRRK